MSKYYIPKVTRSERSHPLNAVIPVGLYSLGYGSSLGRERVCIQAAFYRGTIKRNPPASPMIDKDPLTVDVPREFHRRMAAIIDAVQTGIWGAGVHDLLGYATDYAFGQQRGLQTLVLKSKHRSAYVRLHWDRVMGDTDADRQLVDLAIKSAINELS